MKLFKSLSLYGLALLASLTLPLMAQAAPADTDALKGVTNGKALFDINLSNINQVPLYLQVIGMTHDGLVGQGVEPKFVVAFRGASVQFISNQGGNDDTQAIKQQIAKSVSELASKGVKFEACAIATNLFQVDNDSLLPEVKVVGNTFISLIGYQAQGYGTIPVM
ncbi:Intracellular sulfur oxidation protein, DsrE/DsrF family [Ferrimonas sediminum]|uniref:Intracellular sulfur oxidation protein, DsrE/DsrF family n=1 Tax=Ferrimonas sediminum TaxID=718193 RepID=A0A1G8UE96_9GAMM|nr:DsrE family protein [Ferrimonas sediminum]SDJ52099.1 Intracellular sulfur oxidation protein, DsrE/DsrF family [Ferrimonas sediminum]